MATKYNSVQGKLRKGGGKGMSGDALVGNVTQSTINDIKKMGMTKALALAGKNGKTSGGMAREFQEGVRRMYGAKRLADAKAKYAPASKSKFSTASRPPVATKSTAKPTSKGTSTANKLKVVGGTVAAIGLLAASKGRAGSAAAKLAPAIGGLAKSRAGQALLGSGKPLASKAFAAAKAAPKANAAKVTVGPKGSFGKTTLTKAKSGLGTASEYASKAGQTQSRASVAAKMGDKTPSFIKATTADKARATATATTAKKAVVSVSKKKLVKAGAAASGAGQTGKK